jgi:uncharacterized protein YrzB (UPF0473 family)
MAKNSFKVIDESGKEMEMEVLFTYKHEANNKNYVVYFNPKDEQGNLFAAGYDEVGKLYPIDNDAEWKIIEEVTQNYLHDNHHDHDHDHDHHGHDHHHHDHDHDHDHDHHHHDHDHSHHDHKHDEEEEK